MVVFFKKNILRVDIFDDFASDIKVKVRP